MENPVFRQYGGVCGGGKGGGVCVCGGGRGVYNVRCMCGCSCMRGVICRNM